MAGQMEFFGLPIGVLLFPFSEVRAFTGFFNF